ncbi:MAG: hypothetical protein JWO39_3053, partial [Gemmatimonadetes bacterium]|nr:hypothetical protein [Gemmatimonadota bacterium]
MERKVSETLERVNQHAPRDAGPSFAISPWGHIDSQSPRVAELGKHTGTVLEAIRMQFIGRALLA